MQAAPLRDNFSFFNYTFDDASYKSYQRDIAEGYDRAKAMRLISGTHLDPANGMDDSVESFYTPSDTRNGPQPTQTAKHQLPPTPPSPQSTYFQEPLLSPSMIPEQARPLSRHSAARVTTPLHAHSPPTPEVTPPSTRDRLYVQRPGVASAPSYISQADTFVTAREDQHSAASSRSNLTVPSQSHTPRANVTQDLHSQFYAVNGGINYRALDYNSTITPTKRSQSLAEINGDMNGHPVETQGKDSDETSEQGNFRADFNRNVTVRRWRPRNESARKRMPVESGSENGDGATSVKPTDVVPAPAVKARESEPRQPIMTNGHTESPNHDEWQDQVNDVLYSHLRDEKAKRLSGESGTSAVIEAIVVVNPPKPRQNLRHAGKNLALRDDSYKLKGRPRMASDSQASHQLRHRKSPIPDRGLSPTSEAKPRVSSSPELTYKRPSDMSARPQLLSKSTNDRRTDVVEKEDTPLKHKSQLVKGLPNTSRVIGGITAVSKAPVSQKEQQAIEEQSTSVPTVQSVEGTEGKASRDRMTRAHANFGTRTGWSRSSEDDDLTSPTRARSARRPSINESAFGGSDGRSSAQQRPTSRSVSDGDNNFRARSDRPSLSSSRQRSSEPRPDHATSRNTPLSVRSQWSDRTDLHELSEATAVSIHAHHNESLVVVQQRPMKPVQQVAPRITSQKAVEDFASDYNDNATMPTLGMPVFTAFVDSGTPPPESETPPHFQVTSPLMNPRAAPLPPAIKFIPATPNEESDRQLQLNPDSDSADDAPLTRRQSLVKRARRYSESFIQPLRTLSLSSQRRYSTNQPMSRGSNGLHPFWRPRGFWDDFDSSDSEDDFYDHEQDHEPLPSGGDTSDVPDMPRKMSRRMPGFRGTGGFLLGNSLGMTRHGTNNRRHHVDVSTRQSSESDDHNLRRKRSEHMLRALAGSNDSLGRSYRVRKISGFRGVGVQYVGLAGLKQRMRALKGAKAERAAEKRRTELRDKIGMRVYHDV